MEDAGVIISIVSLPANVINIVATVVRDRLILSDDNTLLRDSSINTLSEALNAYMDELIFNQIIRVTDIEASAKLAEGIRDFKISFLWIRPGDSMTWTQIDREIIPPSGFARIDWNLTSFTYIDE